MHTFCTVTLLRCGVLETYKQEQKSVLGKKIQFFLNFCMFFISDFYIILFYVSFSYFSDEHSDPDGGQQEAFHHWHHHRGPAQATHQPLLF
jgi:hypothetical protein